MPRQNKEAEPGASVLSQISHPVLFQKIGAICAAADESIAESDLLKVSLQKTMDLFGAQRGSIFILKPNGKDLALKASEGMKAQEKQEMVKRMGDGIVGKVAESKKPIVVDDIARDERFAGFRARKGYQSASFICAPLMTKDNLLGVINITDKDSGHRFSADEMQLLDFLASQIALNHQRVQLFHRLEAVAQETAHLKDRLGRSDKETEDLKKKIFINEKLATIGKLAGGIAHEFNNPLDGVMRYTNLCLDQLPEEDEVVRSYLLEIKQGLNRMANIVKNLLACSRNEVLAGRTVRFGAALDAALGSLQRELNYKNIKVSRNIDVGEQAILDLGLELVITNILRNAVDVMADGGGLKIEAAEERGELVFSVTDTGCGIPPDKVEQIFEPFYTTKDMSKGCGLGLTIVGEIIKGYHGRVDVKSLVGKGTTFTVYLPVQ